MKFPGVLLIGFAALGMACNGTTPATTDPTTNPTTTSLAASSDTKTKTSIQTWNIGGSGTNITIAGVNANGQTIHSLSATHNTNGSTSILKGYFANGAKLQSESFEIGQDGKFVTLPQGKTDASLCPDCMSNDLETLSTASSGQLRPQLSLACGQARSHLAKVYARVSRLCFGADYLHVVACLDAFYTDLPNALEAVQTACAP